MFRNILMLIFLVGLLVSCQNEEQEFRKRTSAAGQSDEEGRRQVQYNTALQGEAYLERLNRFYEALRGTYEGTLQTPDGTLFNIAIALTPSLPPYPVDLHRVRTLEEVTFNINSLHFNAQVRQWTPGSSFASGCIVNDIHPNMMTGEIPISSKDCSNRYVFYLFDIATEKELSLAETAEEKEQELARAQEMANEIWEGRLKQVLQLRGQTTPSNSSMTYEFLTKRTFE